MNVATVWAIAVKDLRQLVRDRTLLLFILLLPVLQLLLLAQATSRGIRDVPVAVLDEDRTSESRALIALLDASSRFEVARHPGSLEEAERAIELGDVYAVLSIPRGTMASLYHPTQTTVIPLIIDATNSIMARVIEGGIQEVLLRFTQQRGNGATAGVQVESVMLYNPSLETRPNTQSAQLGFIIYQVTLGVAALGLAREREIGTLEQLMVTPVRRVELLVGKAIPPSVMGLLDFLVLSMVLRYGFGIPIAGPYWFLVLGSSIFIVVEVAWGLMISSLAGTQQQAILLVFMQAMVDVALSGFLVPVRDMPSIFRFVAQFVPLNYYLVFVRAVVLKGATFADMWSQLAALVGLGAAIGVVASLAISRNLE